jgi:hypothetical protein
MIVVEWQYRGWECQECEEDEGIDHEDGGSDIDW